MPSEEYLSVKLPDLLFQYCGRRAVDVFEHSRIKSSTPSTLNDPFEWKPSIHEDVTLEQIWNTMNKLRAKNPLPVPPNRFIVAKMKGDVPDADRRRQDQFGTDLEQRTRIICLSERNDGILMWAHYADRHRGFVIGFRSGPLRRDHPQSQFCKVRYGVERPVVPHPYVAPPDGDQLITAVSSKSEEWKYEEEWRLLVDLTHLRRDEDSADTNWYLPISREAIDQVIFGSRCPDALITSIETALKNTPGSDKVRRFRARLDPKLFKILVEAV